MGGARETTRLVWSDGAKPTFRGGQNPPRARVVSQVRGPLNRYGRNRLTVSGNNSKLQGLKVLVIDDSKTIRRTAETLLAKEGCEVYTAIDGFDALAKIADHQPDIVFVDIMMPRLDGYQTCSLIKHNKVFRSIPVIMLTSKGQETDRIWGLRQGAIDYMVKPVSPDQLVAKAQATLSA